MRQFLMPSSKGKSAHTIGLVLSGGVGIRLGENRPKQYLNVCGKPIIGYCLEVFEDDPQIDGILIVASEEWQSYILRYIEKTHIQKFLGFASSGKSRQHSILNGLSKCREIGLLDSDKIIIHDAARPNVSADQINKCIELLDSYDCVMPVIHVKDTVYYSEDGMSIASLLKRDNLYAGQTPEGCRLGTYLAINLQLSDAELAAVRGTSAIAFEKGLSVRMFPGDEQNYKITTKEDFHKFCLEKQNLCSSR